MMTPVRLLTQYGKLVALKHLDVYEGAESGPDVIVWGAKVYVRWARDHDPDEYREASCRVLDARK